jgi:hypothetical protein
MKTILTTALAIINLIALGQSVPAIQWQKSLGGDNEENAYSVQQTSDGGYIVAGATSSNNGDVSGSHGNFDYWVVKLGKTGAIQWKWCYGGICSDQAYSVQQTNDGGYIVAGASCSNNGDVSGNHGGRDYWVVKLGTTGAIQWQKSIGGSSDDFGTSVQQTNDGGYIVAGSSWSNDGDVSGNHGGFDYWIVKLKKNGSIQWQKCVGGSGDDHAYFVRQTKDTGYIVAGYSNSWDLSGNHGANDYWIVKFRKNGSIQWQKSLGGSIDDYARSIQQTADGGYIVAGNAYSNDGDVSGNDGGGDYWIVKLKKNGSIQWQKCLGGSSLHDYATSVQQTKDSGYIVAGYTFSNDGDVSGNHGGFDYWIVKLRKNGSIQWQKCFGGTYTDEAHSIQQTSDGGYIVAGGSDSNDGDVSGNHLGNDYWIVKLSNGSPSLFASVANAAQAKNSSKDFTVSPNPAKDILQIQTKSIAQFSVINSSGKILFTKPVNGNGSINISTLPGGNYYVKNNATGAMQKVIVEK